MYLRALPCVQFHFHDLVFGVYQLALHHSTVNAVDSVEGRKVVDPQLIAFLLKVRPLQQQGTAQNSAEQGQGGRGA